MAIVGMHALIYSRRAAETRRLFGEALGWKAVDAGHGWLIFRAPPAELAIHPSEEDYHELLLMCDDIRATVRELRRKGIAVAGPIRNRSRGLATALRLPGGASLGLYQPRHPVALVPRRPHKSPARTPGRRGSKRAG